MGFETPNQTSSVSLPGRGCFELSGGKPEPMPPGRGDGGSLDLWVHGHCGGLGAYWHSGDLGFWLHSVLA